MKTHPKKIKEAIDFINSRSIIVLLDQEIVQQAVDYSVEKKLGAIDALIYSSTESVQSILITADADFQGLPDVEIIRQDDQL